MNRKVFNMDERPTQIMQYVNTGEVSTGGIETILNSGAIGSCVVVAALDPILRLVLLTNY
jgi:chemotaxis receptor (MCP) glutamine deamidase CheD